MEGDADPQDREQRPQADTPAAQERAHEEWYGVQEAARFLGLHRSTLHLAIQRGRLTPDLRTPGGHARFRRTTLQTFQRRLVDEAATSEAEAFAPTQTLATLARRVAAGQSLRVVCQAAVEGVAAAEPGIMCCVVFRATEQDTMDEHDDLNATNTANSPNTANTPNAPGEGDDPRLLGRRGSATALRLYASQGFSRRFFRTYTLLRTQTRASFATIAVLRTREAQFCDDIARSSDAYPFNGTARLLNEMGMRSYGVVPVATTERAVGALVVGSEAPHHFALHERIFLQGVADQLATALRMQRGRRRNESAMQTARALLARAFSLRADADAATQQSQRRTPRPARRTDNSDGATIESLMTLFTQQTGAAEVCALGFDANALTAPLETCDDYLLDLARAANTDGMPTQRHWQSETGATRTGLALSVPLVSGGRGAVAAVWDDAHAPLESDRLLLMAFASACALLAEPGTR